MKQSLKLVGLSLVTGALLTACQKESTVKELGATTTASNQRIEAVAGNPYLGVAKYKGFQFYTVLSSTVDTGMNEDVIFKAVPIIKSQIDKLYNLGIGDKYITIFQKCSFFLFKAVTTANSYYAHDAMQIYIRSGNPNYAALYGRDGMLVNWFSRYYHQFYVASGFDNKDIISYYNAAISRNLYSTTSEEGTNKNNYFAHSVEIYFVGVKVGSVTRDRDWLLKNDPNMHNFVKNTFL